MAVAVKLSVNVNKVATVRNSRGGRLPSVIDAVRVCIDAGAPGITVHPRADARHITRDDVLDVAAELAPLKHKVEYNIEGDPRPDLVELVLEVRPDQCTLVPVMPGEITSQAGWPMDTPREGLEAAIRTLQGAGVRVSLFVDPDGPPCSGPLSVARIASSSTPSRSRARSSAGQRCGGELCPLCRRRALRARMSAWASTPATISTCGT